MLYWLTCRTCTVLLYIDFFNIIHLHVWPGLHAVSCGMSPNDFVLMSPHCVLWGWHLLVYPCFVIHSKPWFLLLLFRKTSAESSHHSTDQWSDQAQFPPKCISQSATINVSYRNKRIFSVLWAVQLDTGLLDRTLFCLIVCWSVR